MKILKINIVHYYILIACSQSVYSQLVQTEFEHLNSEQGLSPSSAIHNIYQDQQGFMWFCTEDGLNRYDGYNFKIYKHDPLDSNSLGGNFATSILQDKNGIMWITLWGAGLDKFDPITETFTHYKNDSADAESLGHNFIISGYEDSNGELWFASASGLEKFDLRNNKFYHFRPNPDDSNSLDNKIVCGVYEDSGNRLWVYTQGGLNLFDRNTNRFRRFNNLPNSPSMLISMTEDASGRLWIGTVRKGLYSFDPIKMKFDQYNTDSFGNKILNDDYIISIHYDSGLLWLGTSKGMDLFDPEKKKIIAHYEYDIQNPKSLSNNRIRQIYEDRSGALWIATLGGGVNKVKNSKNIQAFKLPLGANTNIVWSMFETTDGKTWIGTDGSGLYLFDRVTDQVFNYRNDPAEHSSLSNDIVRAVFMDSKSNLWIGTHKGLNQFHDGKFIQYRNDPKNSFSISSDFISSISEDSLGNLWIGTAGGGLNRFDRSIKKFFRYHNESNNPNSLSHNHIFCLYTDKQKTLWIGTRAGLDRYNGDGTFSRFLDDPRDSSSLKGTLVSAIYEDKDGILWVGTITGGLNKFDQERKRFTHFNEKNGLPTAQVLGILEDGHDNLWISSNSGITKFDKKKQTFRTYDTHDGLQDNEFNRGAFFKNKNGVMFFGGINGFNVFHPDSIKDNPFIPPVVITSFKKNNREFKLARSITMTDEISLNHDDYVISFEFAALSFVSPQKNQYAYKLEGFDKDWIYSGHKRDVTYTNLDPGHYVFKVKGSNNDGLWNEKSTDIKIFIAPPFWKTWWFLLGIVLMIVAGIYAGMTYRIQRLLELERMRTKIAIDLHDHVGSGLTEIAILSEVGFQQPELPHETIRDKFKKIGDTARQLSQNMGDIVWLINPKYDSLGDIILQLKKSYEEIFYDCRIAFRCSPVAEWNQFHLSIENRKHLYLVLKEAINNSLKHSGCNEIKLMVHYQSNGLEVIYEDNGKGFIASDSAEGNGLPNMVHRIQSMGGLLEMDSVLGRGTRITITFSNSKKLKDERLPKGGVTGGI